MITKICKECKKEKPLNYFFKSPSNKDGFYSNCKKCYTNKRKEYHKKYFKIWRKENYGISKSNTKKYQTEQKRKHRKNNPKKAKARSIVTVALTKGKLKRQPCELCGKRKVDAHHIDYNKPLEVTWLCRKHHLFIHRLLRGIKKMNLVKIKKVA